MVFPVILSTWVVVVGTVIPVKALAPVPFSAIPRMVFDNISLVPVAVGKVAVIPVKVCAWALLVVEKPAIVLFAIS